MLKWEDQTIFANSESKTKSAFGRVNYQVY